MIEIQEGKLGTEVMKTENGKFKGVNTSCLERDDIGDRKQIYTMLYVIHVCCWVNILFYLESSVMPTSSKNCTRMW